ncbi:MAG: hypothetical protein ACRED5_22550 [Propylenella sp.]
MARPRSPPQTLRDADVSTPPRIGKRQPTPFARTLPPEPATGGEPAAQPAGSIPLFALRFRCHNSLRSDCHNATMIPSDGAVSRGGGDFEKFDACNELFGG